MQQFDQETQRRIDEWLSGPYDKESKQEIRSLIETDPQQIIDAFYTDIAFGTAGLRGVMGVGTNRVNCYTIRKATEGVAQFLLAKKKTEELKVIIGYDNRHNSELFAKETARVFAGHKIRVYLLNELRPTPYVSFGCRYFNCDAAIMITASHNPSEYNGYKVYGPDGGQVVPPDDEQIISYVKRSGSIEAIPLAEENDPHIISIDGTLDKEYLKAIQPQALFPKENVSEGENIKIIYTSLHGAGITLVPEALKNWGFSNLSLVETQIIPHGDFPTVSSPNPESKEALRLGISQLIDEQADLLIATDPDADRVGIASRDGEEIYQFNGNEIAALCAEHICNNLAIQNRMPERPAIVTTIVTSDLIERIAEANGIACFKVLTGFKWIAEKIRSWEEDPQGYNFLFGAEESYGYLMGTHARDKDAVISSCLLSEIALKAKREGKTLKEQLDAIYRKYGVFREQQLSLSFSAGQEGQHRMKALMDTLRNSPPQSIGSDKIVAIEDYLKGEKQDLSSRKVEKLTLPHSNVLSLSLANGGKLIIRPSGTEPKVKLYALAYHEAQADLEIAKKECEQKLEEMLKNAKISLDISA